MKRVSEVTYGLLVPGRIESDTCVAPHAEEMAYREVLWRCDYSYLWEHEDWVEVCNRPLHPCAYGITDSLSQEGLLAIRELFRNEVS